MNGINKVILLGTLGADPETRYTTSGSAITAIKLATSKVWKDKATGTNQKKTEWHKVKFFGRLAGVAGEYLKKGSQAYVEGELQTEEYEKDGVKRYFTSVVASEMQMLGGRQESRPASTGNGDQIAKLAGKSKAEPAQNDPFDDSNIPF